MNGCLYSAVACAMWPMTWRIARAYGREARMSSCALRIFEAETISSARVTLRVFATLLILVRISLAPAIYTSFIPAQPGFLLSLALAFARSTGAGKTARAHRSDLPG